MRNKFLIAIFALIGLATANINAQQKIGYISLDYILAQMPEAKEVEAEVKPSKGKSAKSATPKESDVVEQPKSNRKNTTVPKKE